MQKNMITWAVEQNLSTSISVVASPSLAMDKLDETEVVMEISAPPETGLGVRRQHQHRCSIGVRHLYGLETFERWGIKPGVDITCLPSLALSMLARSRQLPRGGHAARRHGTLMRLHLGELLVLFEMWWPCALPHPLIEMGNGSGSLLSSISPQLSRSGSHRQLQGKKHTGVKDICI
jgi:hypothetical protein